MLHNYSLLTLTHDSPQQRARHTWAGRTFCFVTSFPTGNEQGGWHGYRWQRRILIRTGGELGEDPAWLVVQGNRWRRRGQERQRLCLQSRRASDDRVRPRRQLPPLIWRTVLAPAAWRVTGATRPGLANRGWRPHRPPVHAGRKGAADPRNLRQAGTLHERRAIPSLHPHRDVSAGRHLCVRPTAMVTRACTNTRRTASCCSPGAGLAPIRASSTSRTT